MRLESAFKPGDTSGDHARRFPLHPRYRRYVDSDFPDLKNGTGYVGLAQAFA